jgi:myosin heavy subunit
MASKAPQRGPPEAEVVVGNDDMITMDDLTPESLLKNLEIRYNAGLIYVSSILQ